MKNLTYHEMEADLKKRFPEMKILCNSEFTSSYPKGVAFWAIGSDEQTYSDKDKNPLYLANDYYNNKYELNIYKKFHAFCKARGWFASSENYTLQIFK